MTRMELAHRIAAARNRSGRPQKAVAEEAGISQSVWHRVEHGETARVAPETLVRMAAAVGIDVEFIEDFRPRKNSKKIPSRVLQTIPE